MGKEKWWCQYNGKEQACLYRRYVIVLTVNKPIDSDTYKGRILFGLAAALMNLAYYWYAFVGIFTTKQLIDDAPELR